MWSCSDVKAKRSQVGAVGRRPDDGCLDVQLWLLGLRV